METAADFIAARNLAAESLEQGRESSGIEIVEDFPSLSE
jgi:hypothetical protein